MIIDKKKIRSFLVILALTSAILTILIQNLNFPLEPFQIDPARASTTQTTLFVPDNYSTISSAIANSPEGATIIVRRGTYYENPVIDKQLTIEGEDPSGTIVVGAGNVDKGAQPVFEIVANNVRLSGFTIESLNYSTSALHATGIILKGDNCTIANNRIEGTYYGIFCSAQSYTIVSNNNITKVLKDAIRFLGGSFNAFSENNLIRSASSGLALAGYSNWVLNNNIANNGRGIGLQSSYTVVFGNNITGNTESGFYYASSDCLIAANQIANSKWGIYFTSYFANPNNDTFYNNNFLNNQHDVGADSSHIVECWNQPYPTGGNYYSIRNGADARSGPSQNTQGSDGILDSPYSIIANNTDAYPLATPFNLTLVEIPPGLPSAPQSSPDSTIASWHCDQVTQSGVTLDSTGNNPAVLSPGSGSDLYHPILVTGKYDKALRYNGSDYTYVAASPSLEMNNELTIDAWVNAQAFKNVTYNNIVVEAAHSFGYPARVWGIAINGATDGSAPLGALRGFITLTNGQFNEITTTTAVVPVNEWIHVVFTRSLTTGMHIYVNGVEQKINVTSGTRNPTGKIWRGTELYIGHDSITTLDEITVRNSASAPTAKSAALPWVIPTVAGVAIAIAVGTGYLLFKKNSQAIKSQKLKTQ